MKVLLCPHCRGYIVWSRYMDDWYCYDCQTHDTIEEDDPAEDITPASTFKR